MNKHRTALNALYAHAISEDLLPPGANPVALLPRQRRANDEAQVDPFEAPEVVLILEALRLGVPRHNRVAHCFREYVATLLYTGLRPSEAQGLLVRHVRFTDHTLVVRRHARRSTDLKTEGSDRVVPLYPQLAAILAPYCDARREEVGDDGFLFARWSPDKKAEVMLGNVNEAWHSVLKACEIPRHTIYACRHTFASHALQLLRGGAPISDLDVAWLLGHGNALLVRRRYGHRLTYIPPRSEALEFNAEHWVHLPEFYARLTRLYEKAGVKPEGKITAPTTARVSP